MRCFLSMLALLIYVDCAAKASEPQTAEVNGEVLYLEIIDDPPNPLGRLPATFSGTLPCADCPGIDVQLDLLADGAYFLGKTYQDRDNGSFDDIGRYLLSSHPHQISLHGERETPMRFALSSTGALTLLDQDGGRIDSELNYSLSRQPEFQPIQPRVLMRGMYRYLADAGRFRECLTGLDMPVATEADNRALEEAYLAVREAPGEAFLVSLEGRIVKRMPMEGPGPVPVLVPERFIGIWPEQSCPELVRLAEFENTYWQLTLIDRVSVQRVPNQREPHLIFHEDGRLAGSDGCNRVLGSYEREGSTIAFSQLATTRMICPEGMEQADRFGSALQKVDSYRIVGRHMEMLDSGGSLRLRFEEVR